MAQQKVELRKIRDFGMNINDTFLFLKQNLKPILKAFFAICGIFLIGEAIFSGIYNSRTFSVFNSLFGRGGDNAYTYESPYSRVLSLEYLMMLVFMLLSFVSMKVVIGSYIKFYLENNGEKPTINDIWTIFKKYFFRVFLYSIPIAIMTAIGFVFCIAPGIYLWVAWVPFTLVVMIEDTSFNGAFNRCFDIIRQNFWGSFAVYLVSYIIYSVSSSIISITVALLVGLLTYFTTRDFGTTMGFATSFLNIFSFGFYMIYFVSAALQYFTLVEQRDGTGILQKIDNIGTDKNNFDNIEEQY